MPVNKDKFYFFLHDIFPISIVILAIFKNRHSGQSSFESGNLASCEETETDPHYSLSRLRMSSRLLRILTQSKPGSMTSTLKRVSALACT